MTEAFGRPTYLHKLQRLAALVHNLSTHWSSHIAKNSVKEPTDLKSPVPQPSVAIVSNLAHLRAEVDSLNLRTTALCRFGYSGLPMYSLPVLLQDFIQPPTGPETGSWQFQRPMADAGYELEYADHTLFGLEGWTSLSLDSCIERMDECLRLERDASFQRAVSMVEEMRSREIEGREGTDDLASAEDVRGALKRVGEQELLRLLVLVVLSDLGRRVGRQMLITEFFEFI